MRYLKRIAAGTVALAMSVSLFAGCSKPKEIKETDPKTTADASTAEPASSGKISEKPITLKYWSTLSATVVGVSKTLADVELYKELEKRSNIKMEFIHPVVGQEKDSFNILIASRDLPDIIEADVGKMYPGGSEKALADNVIIKLNDLIAKNGPNIRALMDKEPAIAKAMKNDQGDILQIASVTPSDLKIKVYGGLGLRKDLMEELKLPVPETMDEWENVLRAFKNKGIEFPLSYADKSGVMQNNAFFIGAYGVTRGDYSDNGKIKYGPMEPGYKEFLKTYSKWYKEGLIDPDLFLQDQKAWETKVTNSKVGAIFGFTGGNYGKFLDADPKLEFIPAQYPVLKKGDKPNFVPQDPPVKTGGNTFITTVNKYPTETMKWIDYAFSEEGHMLYSFGVEGLSYKMENGYPKYTELITNNPDKLSLSQALSKYTRANYPAIGWQDDRYLEQYYKYPMQREAAKLWGSMADNSGVLRLIGGFGISYTADEAARKAKISSETSTYVSEMWLKFIMGQEPIENFDKYVEQLKKMNIEEAVKISQDAYDRFMKR